MRSVSSDNAGIIQALVDRGVQPAVATTYVAATSPPPATGGPSPTVRDQPPGATESYPQQNTGGGGTTGLPFGPTGSTNPAVPPPSAPGPATGDDIPTPPPPVDWRGYLIDWGFPPDVVDELTRIFRTYSDPSQASAASLAYIRGTAWYSQTFPGIQEGQRLGVIGNEADYRAYVNSLNQTYRGYLGRDVSTSEVYGYLHNGQTPTYAANHFQGQALLNSQRGEIQYELGAFDENGRANDSDLSQYGDYLGGIGNMIGPQLQAKIDKARARMQTIFQGSESTPTLSILNNGRLSGPQGKNSADVAA